MEPLDPEHHGPALYEASHSDERAKEVWTYLPDGPFESSSVFKEWLKRKGSEPGRLFYAFRDKTSDRLAGMANYFEVRPAMGSLEIGYVWFAPFWQRTTQATEAFFLMLSYAFDTLKYRRVQWRCNAVNHRSRSAATRLGFIFEGVWYQDMVVKGRNRDTAWYSILDNEWPRLRANFERWLAPSNFDEQGHQHCSLRQLNETRTDIA
ncbi:MAG: GNAT family N-acetyltransferase [Burkholderiales bacterium]